MSKILCKIRGKKVEETEEEIVRQNTIDDLIQIYNYDIDNMAVEYHVKATPSDTNKSVPVDIAIFENGVSKIFIETKKPGDLTKDNLGQLEDYMSFDSNVKWGVLTNGKDKIFIEKIYEPKIHFKKCFNIPSKGFSEIAEEIKICDLKENVNLKNIFKNIRSYVTANDIGITQDQLIVEEIIKLVLCKTYDEKFTIIDDFLSFHIYNKNKEVTFEKISNIYENVKSKYDEVFEKNDKIKLDKNSVFLYCSSITKYLFYKF